MNQAMKVKLKSSIEIIQRLGYDETEVFGWTTTMSYLQESTERMAIDIFYPRLIRLQGLELQQWDPADDEWHESLLTYNDIVQGEYKFCKFKEQTNEST